MNTVRVYGASDDLIEVEGDVREEFMADQGYVVFSDGTVVSIHYGSDGRWAVRHLEVGSCAVEIRRATNDTDDYSDVADVTGEFEWIVFAGDRPLRVGK